jgi:hypothetical protein
MAMSFLPSFRARLAPASAVAAAADAEPRVSSGQMNADRAETFLGD